MAFKLEKNIPIKSAKYTSFPFKEMEIGDSFLVPIDFCKRQTIHNHLTAFNRENNVFYKLSIKKEKDGFRVWRVL